MHLKLNIYQLYLIVLCAICFEVKGQTIRITGKVFDETRQPLPGVIVKLDAKGFLDTTDNEGTFNFTKDITNVLPADKNANIYNRLGNYMRVYDLHGRLISQISGNENTWASLLKRQTSSGVYIQNFTISGSNVNRKVAFGITKSFEIELIDPDRNDYSGPTLKKRMAVLDSLVFTKQNYESITKEIDSYQISLDSVIMRRIPQWVAVGGVGFAEGAIVPKLVSANDTLYLAYTDKKNGTKATVYKLVDTTWQLIGPAGFSDQIISTSTDALRFSVGQSKPFIVHDWKGSQAELHAKAFTESQSWQTLVRPPQTSTSSTAVSVSDGTLHVLNGIPYLCYYNSGFYDIEYYQNDAWTRSRPSELGVSGPVPATEQSLASDGNSLFFTYSSTDWQNNWKLNVRKLASGVWSNVGNTDFGDANRYAQAIYVDNGVPYVFASDQKLISTHTFSIYAMKLVGDVWTNLANLAFDPATSPGMNGDAVNSITYGVLDSLPYIAYSDRLFVFYKQKWLQVGGSLKVTGISSVNNVSLAFVKGNPYIAYHDDWAHSAKLVVVTLK